MNEKEQSNIDNGSANLELVHQIISVLRNADVTEFILCAGARNSPFIVYFEESLKGLSPDSFSLNISSLNKKIKTWNFFEERSAAFFALGRIRSLGQPVAIITTSGTAAAELLPAAVEATYAGLPLIMITADRPEEYRGSGAPQTIEQIGIFSHYIEREFELSISKKNLDFENLSWKKPLHLNVSFAEPLIPKAEQLSALWNQSFSYKSEDVKIKKMNGSIDTTNWNTIKNFFENRKPAVILGALEDQDQTLVIGFLKKLGAPIYAEAISQLRGHPDLAHLQIKCGDSLLQHACQENIIDSVVRIGGVPTLRLWRDLEERYRNFPVLSFSSSSFSGLARNSTHIANLQILEDLHVVNLESHFESLFSLDRIRFEFIEKLFKDLPNSEPSLIHTLSLISKTESIYLGNSLPIREWDFAASYEYCPQRVYGNRGANGIDGQISTFLGWSNNKLPHWGVFGDLTTMYDLSAPWITSQIPDHELRLVIINNQGGQIFDRMFQRKAFLNSHEMQFISWAHFWNWSYQLWKEIPVRPLLKKRQVIEIHPSNQQTYDFWKAHDGLWRR